MSTPAVNIVLRLDQSKVGDDAKKAESTLKSAINPTVDVFNVAEKAAKGLAEAMSKAFSVIASVAEKTGGFQAFERAVDGTSRALFGAADRSGALRSAFGEVDKVANKLTSYLNSKEGRGAVNDFFSAMITGAADAIDAINGLYRAAIDTLESLKKTSIVDAFRRGLVGRGLSDGFSESLDPDQTPEEKYGKVSTSAEDLANNLRNSAKKPVEATGTYVDQKAIDAAKASNAALEAQIQQAFGRAEAQRKHQVDQLKAAQDYADNLAKIDQGITDTASTNAERREEIAREEVKSAAERVSFAIHNDTVISRNLASAKKRDEDEINETRMKFDTLNQVSSAGWASIAGGVAEAFQGKDFGAAVAQMLGPAIATIGASLFATALAANALATVFPAIALAFGIVPGLSVPAAIAAVGVGTALMAGGGLLTSLVSGGPSALEGAGGSLGGAVGQVQKTSAANTPQGFQGAAGTNASPMVFNNSYNFNGPRGGSPRRIARDLRDLSDAGDSLLPTPRGSRGRRR